MTLFGARVSHEFFPVFRVRPLLGRAFLPEDEVDGNHRVVMLGHAFWADAFGGAPAVIGQTIELDSEMYRIVGVMPEDFTFRFPVTSLQEAQIYVPLRIRAVDRVRGQSRNYNYTIVGRLKQGVDMAVASDSMATLSRGLAEQYPDWWSNRQADVVPLHQHLAAHVAPRMRLLLLAIAGVMVVACVNVANLLLVRSTVRVRDTSMRAALGAPRSRLVRIMMVEGLVIAASASVLGLGIAHGLVAQAIEWLPPDLPRINSVAVDGRVTAMAVAAAMFTSVLFSLGPALSASKPGLERRVRGGVRLAGSHRGERTRAALLVTEVALATVLVTGASLFTGSLVNWLRVDVGFDSRHLLTFVAPLRPNPQELAAAQAKGADAAGALQREFEIRGDAQARTIGAALLAQPGVEAVSVVDGGVPLTGGYGRGPFSLPGRAMPSGVEPYMDYRRVAANYADVLRLPMREGRYLSAEDEATRSLVAVVNESAARAYWPGESALGQQLRLFDTTTLTVVGVMRDMRHLGPERPTLPEVHIAIDSWASASFVVRTTRPGEIEMPSIREAVASVNRDQVVLGDVFALESYADRLVALRRFTMVLFLVLGIVGLAIAAAGVYGVMAYSVSQRRQEIGVRMALGARPADVVSMVLGRSLALVAMGLLIGAAGAWYASSAVEAFLFELSPTDMRIYAIAIVTIGIAGIAASLVPARRAAKVDPLMALRAE